MKKDPYSINLSWTHGGDQPHVQSFHSITGMPFTVDDLAAELSRIPAVKAVARPCAPGAVWKCLANDLAPFLHAKLQEWWFRPTPILPSWFRDSRALRPLALQEPISKSIVGLLTKKALTEALPSFVTMPLWAYLPGRSTKDALLRVAARCRGRPVPSCRPCVAPHSHGRKATKAYHLQEGCSSF